MSWNTVRLELARTKEFPRGSVSRAYLVRVPLDDAGMIDGQAISANPQRATVRRFWPCQPDQTGRFVKEPVGWCFSFVDEDEKVVFRFHGEPLCVGCQVTVTNPDGTHVPFRVASMKRQNARISSPMT